MSDSNARAYRRSFNRKIAVHLTIIALAAFALTLPFINKALHNDDNAWLYTAHEAAEHPANPYKGTISWMGNELALIDAIPHPPFIPYFIALMLFIHDSELWLHISFLSFTLLALISMYYLADYFTSAPLFSTLLLMSSGSFMVMSNSLHTDIAMLAFYIFSITTYVYGMDKDNLGISMLSSIGILLSIFTSYQSLSLFPLLILYSAIKRHSLLSVITVLSGPAILFLGWCVHNYIYLGDVHILRFLDIKSPAAPYIKKTVYTLASIGGTGIFPFCLVAGLWKNRYRSVYAILFFITCGAVIWYVPEYSSMQKLLLVIFLYTGIFVTLHLFVKIAPDELFFTAWAAGVIVYNIVFMPFGAARYILPFLPPLLILFVRQVGNSWKNIPCQYLLKIIIIAFSLIQGISMNYSDYEFANAARDSAAKLIDKYGKNHALFFTGIHGLQYYLTKAGGLPLTGENYNIKEGDIIVIPENEFTEVTEKGLQEELELIDTISVDGAIPVRIISYAAKAGFYHHQWGLLPYSLSRDKVEEYRVYKAVANSLFIKNLSDAIIKKDTYMIDLGSALSRYSLASGWSGDEKWADGITVVWADRTESTVTFYTSSIADRIMLFRATPFIYKNSPSQEISIYLNNYFVKTLTLNNNWDNYQTRLPARFFINGKNMLRFKYRYAESPFLKIQGSSDTRTLAVAFDYIMLQDENIYNPLNISAADDNIVHAKFTINEITRHVLYQHPDSAIAFNVNIPPDAHLRFGIGIDQSAWDKEGDGVEFKIYAELNRGNKNLLFSRYIDPKNNKDDRRWFDEDINLTEFGGDDLTIIFTTDSGYTKDTRYDRAGWSGLEIR